MSTHSLTDILGVLFILFIWWLIVYSKCLFFKFLIAIQLLIIRVFIIYPCLIIDCPLNVFWMSFYYFFTFTNWLFLFSLDIHVCWLSFYSLHDYWLFVFLFSSHGQSTNVCWLSFHWPYDWWFFHCPSIFCLIILFMHCWLSSDCPLNVCLLIVLSVLVIIQFLSNLFPISTIQSMTLCKMSHPFNVCLGYFPYPPICLSVNFHLFIFCPSHILINARHFYLKISLFLMFPGVARHCYY